MQLAAASLVAAIPAGILATLLVMMILSHSENFKTMTWVAVGGSLLFSSVTLLMPFGILVLSGKSAAKAAAPKAADKKPAKADDDEPEVTGDDALMSDSEVEETVEFHGESSSEVEAIDDEDLEVTDDEDFFDEEEEKPKKKGKKK
jgi:hypothetical protein